MSIDEGVRPTLATDGDPPAAPSRRPPDHRRWWLLGTALTLVALGALSLALGARPLAPEVVWNALTDPDGGEAAVIVWEHRLPRTLLGVLVGVALGLAGALMQALTRNPLADPGLLGVTMGASAAVVVGIAFLGVGALTGYLWFAVAGAAGASALVYLISGRSAAPDRMVLAGAAISAVLLAFTSAVLLQRPDAFRDFRFWDVGSLAGRGLDVAAQTGPLIGFGAVVALALARPLNALALGEDSARSLGAAVGRTRIWGALAVTALCGAATAAAGPIGFVGLVVAHAARIIIGPDLRWLLPCAALLTPSLLLAADIVGRLAIAPAELSVGVVTAVIGAPVFIALCRRSRLGAL
ncbi:FecCD family ABC transporter permease [Pilimelia columellifera]